MLQQEGDILEPILQNAEIDVTKLKAATGEALASEPVVSGAGNQPQVSNGLRKTLDAADEAREKWGDEYHSVEHFLLGALKTTSPAGEIIRNHGLRKMKAKAAIKSVRGSMKVTDESPEEKYQALEKYGMNLTDRAREGKIDSVIGRDQGICRVLQVLARHTKNNPVLIGEPRVGKTAIVEGLACRIVSGDVPDLMKDKKVVSVDMGAMLAGAKYRVEFEDHLKAFFCGKSSKLRERPLSLLKSFTASLERVLRKEGL